MLKITATITNLDETKADLLKLSDSFEDFTETLEALSITLLMYYGETAFVSRGEVLGTPWEPLKPATQKEKDKKWPGRGILQRSGAMQQGFYGDVTPRSLYISNHVKYFEYNQLGTGEQGKGTVPGVGRGKNLVARPMLGVDDGVKDMIQKVFEASIKEKIAVTLGAK